MSHELAQRVKWEIDRTLNRLIGADVRVAARAFSPVPPNRQRSPRLISVRELFLPDNSQPGALPVFFEGCLRQFERRIGVVTVRLDAPALVDAAGEGAVFFRRRMAVVLRGPALVELASPFCVERLPEDTGNYWRDLRMPGVQFELETVAADLYGAGKLSRSQLAHLLQLNGPQAEAFLKERKTGGRRERDDEAGD